MNEWINVSSLKELSTQKGVNKDILLFNIWNNFFPLRSVKKETLLNKA